MFYNPCNPANYRKYRNDIIEYIVVHFDANKTATARNNLEFFAREVTGTSAHYFADEVEVCQSVKDNFKAHHCGSSSAYRYKHIYCRNSNSIGIEMCSRFKNGEYYFPPETEHNAARFIAEKMRQYGIPIENVVRHYDVTGKPCPAPYMKITEWTRFLGLVKAYYSEVDCDMKYYEKLEEIPAGEMRETVKKLIDRKIIAGTAAGLHLSEDMVRMIVYNNRAGLYK